MTVPGHVRGRTLRSAAERISLVALSIATLALGEAALRLLGVGAEEHAALDFGTSDHQPLYAPDPSEPGWVTMAPWIQQLRGRHARKLVNHARFPAAPPPGELRIFAVGESTVVGYPRGGSTAFPRRLEELIAARVTRGAVRVVNAGFSSYDSGRVQKVAQEVCAFDPDVLVIYTGHNEFLRRFALERLARAGWRIRLRQKLARLRTYQLLARLLRPLVGHDFSRAPDVTPLLDELSRKQLYDTPRGEEETKLVLARFQSNIRRAVEAGHAAGARVVLCTVASRLQAHPEHSVLSVAEMAALRPFLDALDQAPDAAAREAALHAALPVAPGYAPLHHALGAALEAQGRFAEAEEAYVAARELASNPRRGGTAINEAIRAVASDTGAVLVDVERILRSRNDRGCFGQQLFRDHCHPDAEGHAVIATSIFESLQKHLPEVDLPR